MRASEFLFEARGSYETWFDYTQRLIASKIQVLGQGASADVFQHPLYKNVAVKVFGNDPAYKIYLDFILHNPNNRYVPQVIPAPDGKLIHAARLKGNIVKNFVFIKKYQPANRAQLIQQFTEWDKIAGIRSTPGLYGTSGRTANGNWKEWSKSEHLKQQDPDAWTIANLFEKRRWRLDLHGRNYMWDPESGNIVFVDPFV